MTNLNERINELIPHLRKMRLPIMTNRLIDLYGNPLNEKRSVLGILEEIIWDEYQSRRNNTILRDF